MTSSTTPLPADEPLSPLKSEATLRKMLLGRRGSTTSDRDPIGLLACQMQYDVCLATSTRHTTNHLHRISFQAGRSARPEPPVNTAIHSEDKNRIRRGELHISSNCAFATSGGKTGGRDGIEGEAATAVVLPVFPARSPL